MWPTWPQTRDTTQDISTNSRAVIAWQTLGQIALCRVYPLNFNCFPMTFPMSNATKLKTWLSVYICPMYGCMFSLESSELFYFHAENKYLYPCIVGREKKKEKLKEDIFGEDAFKNQWLVRIFQNLDSISMIENERKWYPITCFFQVFHYWFGTEMLAKYWVQYWMFSTGSGGFSQSSTSAFLLYMCRT